MSTPFYVTSTSELSPASSMVAESAFPLEIYEHILDFVGADIDLCGWKRTLASASLVCHGWHPRSRALLFRVLRFVTADEDTLLRYRCHLAVAPHLAAYVEEVRIIHEPEDSRLLEAFPRWLGIYLPRLRAIFVKIQAVYLLKMHHFFCLPSARVQSVTTLEYDYITLQNTSELEGLLFPYPNTRVLTLHRVLWVDNAKKFKGKGLPRPIKTPLALTELRLMLDGTGPTCINLVNRLGYEYILKACRTTLSKLLLNIIPIRLLILKSQEDYPLNVIEFPCLDVLHLEIFMAPTATTIFKDKNSDPRVPYSEVVSMIPPLLRRFKAVRLRILRLNFAPPDIDSAPHSFLEHLTAICGAMEELVLGSGLPNLKAITFDLGCRTRDIPSWQSKITECFQKLEKIVSIQVIPHDDISEDIRSDRQPEFYYGM